MAKHKQVKANHVPMRTCIATKEKHPKKDLLRLVRVEKEKAQGGYQVEIDLKGKKRGRGANIKPSLEAFDQAVKNKAIERTLRLPRKLTQEEVETLREEFGEAVEEKQFRNSKKPVIFKISKKDFNKKLYGSTKPNT